jgi:hypothetical protein
MTKAGDLQIWWIPQVPGKPFTVPVASVAEAKKLLDVLAEYDIFQFRNRIKTDYCNAGGLSVYDGGEWTDWCDEDGNSIDDISMPVADVFHPYCKHCEKPAPSSGGCNSTECGIRYG